MSFFPIVRRRGDLDAWIAISADRFAIAERFGVLSDLFIYLVSTSQGHNLFRLRMKQRTETVSKINTEEETIEEEIIEEKEKIIEIQKHKLMNKPNYKEGMLTNETCGDSLQKKEIREKEEEEKEVYVCEEEYLENKETCSEVIIAIREENEEDCLPEFIENSNLDPYRIENTSIVGRQILSITHLWNELHDKFDHHSRGFDCSFVNLKLVKSTRFGLKWKFVFQCNMCNIQETIWSEPQNDKIMDINKCAVAGTFTTGIGHAQLQELCAAMDIPTMSGPTYRTNQQEMIEQFISTAKLEMAEASKLEAELAIARGDVINGIPFIPVVADGSWIKRTYKSGRYDSLSGVGAIAGYHTQKILFIAVRNKCCTVCDRTQEGKKPKDHKCYKNWSRNASSTSMESDAIVEGFCSSVATHGLIYKTLIADGDSSVYKKILERNPYDKYDVQVTKVECTNHLLRNLSNKINDVSKTKGSGFASLRKVVKSSILPIREAVVLAQKRRNEEIPADDKAVHLQQDILHLTRHMYGDHTRCAEIDMSCIKQNTKNYVPELQKHGLYDKIEEAMQYLSCHADSLLLNLTNNCVEAYNSIICKMIDGKRINFGLRDSYDARCAGSVIQFNTQQVLTNVNRSMDKEVPQCVKNLEERRQTKNAKRRQMNKMETSLQGPKNKKRKASSGREDKDYGQRSEKLDLPPIKYELLKEHHFSKLITYQKNRDEIEKQTRGQNNNNLWRTLRRKLLTASNFSLVCRRRDYTSCAGAVKKILYSDLLDNIAMEYGRNMEKKAKKNVDCGTCV